MDYWEKADYSWSDDSKRHILTPSSKSRTLFYYIQEIGQFKASRPYYTERAHLPSYLIKFTLMVLGNYAIVIIHTAYREVIYSLLTVGIINTIKQPAKILGKWTGFILKEEILVLFSKNL